MGHLARSLGNLFQKHPHPEQHKPPSGQPGPSQQAPASNKPTREGVLNYLGVLANDYQIPAKVVYAVADAESSVNPAIAPHPNYETRQGRIVHDKRGNPIVKSWDYGLMQVNEQKIGEKAKDAHGQSFTIGEDVKTDWRANARAGVAVLADAYRLAELEQGPGETEEDHAQQAYSQYNGGGPRARHRYLKERRDGLPRILADRHFLQTYQEHWKHK